MKFAFIHAEGAKLPHESPVPCLEGVSERLYAWSKRPPSRRDVEDSKLVPVIRAGHAQSRAAYGSPRVHEDLEALSYRVSRKRVARLMRRESLSARPPRRYRATTDSKHSLAIGPVYGTGSTPRDRFVSVRLARALPPQESGSSADPTAHRPEEVGVTHALESENQGDAMRTQVDRMRTFRGLSARLAYVVLLTALFAAAPFHAAWAQVAPTLGAAEDFAVLGATTVTNTGPTVVAGNLGVYPGTSITGFPPGTAGTIHQTDAVSLQAQTDTTAAYIDLAGQICPAGNTFGVPKDLTGMTLVPGVYCFASSAGLTGRLTLDALGNPNAVWVFQIASTLITGPGSTVEMTNGGSPCNVFWQVGSSATLDTSTKFVGNILALTSIGLKTEADLFGRALARNGAVTMDTNTVGFTACSVPPVTAKPPTLAKAFSPNVITAGGTSTLTITLTNPDDTVANSASLTDTLPSGVVINGVASTTCE